MSSMVSSTPQAARTRPRKLTFTHRNTKGNPCRDRKRQGLEDEMSRHLEAKELGKFRNTSCVGRPPEYALAEAMISLLAWHVMDSNVAQRDLGISEGGLIFQGRVLILSPCICISGASPTFEACLWFQAPISEFRRPQNS